MPAQELLDRASEISITEDVRELNEWCELRDDLASSLGRQPTQVRDASAAPARIDLAPPQRKGHVSRISAHAASDEP